MVRFIAAACGIALSIGGGWLLHDVTNGREYLAKADYVADKARRDAQIDRIYALIESQAKNISDMSLLLRTHLAIDDPRFKGHGGPSADFIPKGD